MKKIKLLGLLILLATSSTMFGQQDPHYTQYMYNMSIINPAYVGSRGVPSVTVLAGKQWVGLEGAPVTGTFSINSPFGRATGVGLSVIHDQIGPAKETNLYADYSYTIPMRDEGRLAFGLKGGLSFLDVSYLDLAEDNDPLNTPVNQTSPNFGLGVFYYTDMFYVGLSAPNVLNTKHLEKENGYVSTASEEMHIFLTAGYVIDLGNEVQFKPSTMMRGVKGAPLSVDLSANFLFNDIVEGGLSYRLNDSMNAMVGFQVSPDFRIGYSYGFTTSNSGAYKNGGSHEIILSYEFEKNKCRCPRYF